MGIVKRRPGASAKSSPKILSIEFLVQNHADIVGTIIVIITAGLLFEPTFKYASKFVALHHNTTDPTITFETGIPMQYTYGHYDVFIVIFHCLVCILIHGLIQQYLFDRSARKLHLSRIKHSKFNESGQLCIFYTLSTLWALDLLRKDWQTRSNISQTIGGKQDELTNGIKLYFIAQIAYWAHIFPQVYLDRTKKEEIHQKVFFASLYLLSFLGAYLLNITRLALALAAIHFTAEALFHTARLLYFRQNNDIYPLLFKVWNLAFVVVRVISIVLSVLILALDLGSVTYPATTGGQPTVVKIIDSAIIRFGILSVIFALQIHLMWKYIVFHLARWRPVAQASNTKVSKTKKNVD